VVSELGAYWYNDIVRLFSTSFQDQNNQGRMDIQPKLHKPGASSAFNI
jgi:hypothetical protein